MTYTETNVHPEYDDLRVKSLIYRDHGGYQTVLLKNRLGTYVEVNERWARGGTFRTEAAARQFALRAEERLLNEMAEDARSTHPPRFRHGRNVLTARFTEAFYAQRDRAAEGAR